MEVPVLSNMSFKMFSDNYIEKHYQDFYKYLIERYGNISIKEKLYMYFNGMDEPGRCKVCGGYTKLESFTKGYRTYCSSKCCNSDKDKKDKTRDVMISRYGVINPSQLESVKSKKKETCLKNYGVEHPSQSDEIKNRIITTNIEKYGVEHPSQSDEIKDKFIKTMVDRYGVEHPSQLESVKSKKKETCLKNYGVEHPSQSDEIKKRKIDTCLSNYGVEFPAQSQLVRSRMKNTYDDKYLKDHPDILDIYDSDGERVYLCKCTDCRCQLCDDKCYHIHHKLYHSRKTHSLELCTIKNPIDNKGKNTGIERFVKQILDDYHIEYECNVRLTNNMEIDIYIPSKNIGIECNGVYWHSDKIKHPKYHYDKYVSYRECGIQLLMIWEDWIILKPELVKSLILSKLGLYAAKIYARKCVVKYISNATCSEFLNRNHIQGKCNSSIRLGLFYNDELVSVMTFSRKRRSMIGNNEIKDGEWELTRLCSKLGCQVIGGASKLLTHFIKETPVSEIVSFASHDISNGKLYETLGFDKVSSTSGSYWYIDTNMIRHHRYTFRKSELIRKGYDSTKSEFEIMDNLKYLRIYDSGQSKYILKLKGVK